jgi:lysozyme
MNDYVLTIADLTLTKNSEHCYLTAYPDPASPLGRRLQSLGLWQNVLRGAPIQSALLALSGAPWTIFWGHTGPEVHYGMKGTQAQADAQLLTDMARVIADIKAVVKIQISRNEFIALCDLAFNIGVGNFNASTLLRLLNGGDRDGADAQFAAWNKAGGQVLAGLVARRAAEAAMFATPDGF